MAPIHDTDIAEERWTKAEWNHIELWEKVENRLRKRQWIWIAATAFVALMLSSVPSIMESSATWRARAAARRLAQEISTIKTQASLNHAAYRIRFDAEGKLSYTIEQAPSCLESGFTFVRRGALIDDERFNQFALLSSNQAQELGLEGVVNTFCYDARTGSELALQSDKLAAFSIIPVRDLGEKRMDRAATLLMRGGSAEISFD